MIVSSQSVGCPIYCDRATPNKPKFGDAPWVKRYKTMKAPHPNSIEPRCLGGFHVPMNLREACFGWIHWKGCEIYRNMMKYVFVCFCWSLIWFLAASLVSDPYFQFRRWHRAPWCFFFLRSLSWCSMCSTMFSAVDMCDILNYPKFGSIAYVPMFGWLCLHFSCFNATSSWIPCFCWYLVPRTTPCSFVELKIA